jgi:Ohr subfamily peroxiredoxin
MVRETLYRTSVAVTGGRRGGAAKSDDGRLDLKLDMPREMGGSGGQGTNPEQLFAAGYAACFESAILFLARSEKLNVTQSHVTASVGIGPGDSGPGYELSVRLEVSLPELDRTDAERLVAKAHNEVCPYSKATRGNIAVEAVAV